MNITLVFPPPADPFQPYLVLPALSAALRRAGFAVSQRDLNLEVHDDLLTRRRLEAARKTVRERVAALDTKTPLDAGERAAYAFFAQTLLRADDLCANIDGAKQFFRNETGDYYDIDRYIRWWQFYNHALDLLSAPFFPTRFTPLRYTMRHSANRYRSVEAAADDDENLFRDYFRTQTVPSILEDDPALIGISVTLHDQLIPAFTLAKAIKRSSPQTAVIIGGAVFSRLLDTLSNVEALYNHVDGYIVHEGETALVRLAAAIEQNGGAEDRSGWDTVPNLYFMSEGEIQVPSTIHFEDLDALPTPDLDGLPLERYLVPQPVIPLQTARGCYWGKCAFCNVTTCTHPVPYRSRSEAHIVDDIEKLVDRCGTRHFAFWDNATHPHMLERIANMLLQRGVDIEWYAQVRFEPAFTRDRCQRLADAGCRSLFFGLESAVQRVIERMQKGIDIEHVVPILENCTRAGVDTGVNWFIGFPTETEAEARRTFQFILDNQDLIGYTNLPTRFGLYKESPVARAAGAYGISINQDPQENLALEFDL